MTINEEYVTRVQGEREARAYKSLHNSASDLLAAVKHERDHLLEVTRTSNREDFRLAYLNKLIAKAEER